MTDRRPISDDVADERIRAWLDDRPVVAPRAFVDATMAPIPAMAQRRRSLVAIGRMRVEVATLARFATAAALVLAVLGAVTIARPAAGPGASPSPSMRASPSLRPLPSGVAYTNDGPLGAASGSEPSVAGTYRSLIFRPTVQFTVPAGWSGSSIVRTFVGASESAIGLPLRNGSGEIVFTVPTSVDPPAPGDTGAPVPADLFAWLQANPNLELGEASEAVIGGVTGRVVTGTLSSGATIDPAEDFYRVVDYLPLQVGQTVRLAVFDVDGQQLVVAVIAPTADFAAFQLLADAVLDTVSFPDR